MSMTTVASDLFALLEQACATYAAPRIRALHLPPASSAGGKDGEFCALELEDGAVGMSYVLLNDTLRALVASGRQAQMAGGDALQAARGCLSADATERTLGFAAANALSQSIMARCGFEPDWNTDSIGLLDPQPGDHIGMIGFFPPLVGRVVAAGARLTVAELNPALAGERDGYRVTLDSGELSTCNKVLSTSTVLLNDTVERMLSACSHARYFTMIGPGAGCLPDPLFARGVTLLGGTRVTDLEGFRNAMITGESWGRYTRKYSIRREHYPGLRHLLAGASSRGAEPPRGHSAQSA